MKIPANELDRWQLYEDLSQQIFQSKNDRVGQYERLRMYYLYGCDVDNDPATFNKVYPQIDLMRSFLFAAEAVRFGIILGESAPKPLDLPKVPALTRHLNSKWSDSNGDIVYGEALEWSLVYNSMFVKTVVQVTKGGSYSVRPMLIEPHSFGVLREDLPFLDDQEAFGHSYSESYRTLDRKLASHPRHADIMSRVSASFKREDKDAAPAGVQRIIMSAFPMTGYPNGPGSITLPMSTIDTYRAKITDERVEMRELWVWDDDEEQYRVATMASGGVCVYDRVAFDRENNPASLFISGEHPFVQVCPLPSYDYFFGHSMVEKVTRLQDARERRFRQNGELLDRQVKPPTSQRGQWQGIPDETAYAREVFGGGMSSIDPTAEFKVYAPTIPTDLYAYVREIDADFNDMMGLSNVTQGKGDSGVRSKGHAAELARLGSSRVKQRAYVLEDGLDKLATLYMRIIQAYDKSVMVDDKAQKFAPFQFTKDFTVKVDGHSSSPIFAEDYKQMAAELYQAGIIDGEEVLELVNAPSKQLMIEKWKKISAARAQAAKEEKQAKLASVK